MNTVKNTGGGGPLNGPQDGFTQTYYCFTNNTLFFVKQLIFLWVVLIKCFCVQEKVRARKRANFRYSSNLRAPFFRGGP